MLITQLSLSIVEFSYEAEKWKYRHAVDLRYNELLGPCLAQHVYMQGEVTSQ